MTNNHSRLRPTPIRLRADYWRPTDHKTPLYQQPLPWTDEVMQMYHGRGSRSADGARSSSTDKYRLDPISWTLVAKVHIDDLISDAPIVFSKILAYIAPDQCGRHRRRDLEWASVEEFQAKRDVAGAMPDQYANLSNNVRLLVQHVADESKMYENVTLPVSDAVAARMAFVKIFTVEKANKTVDTLPQEHRDRALAAGVSAEAMVLRLITDARGSNAWFKDDTSFPMFTLDALLQTVSNVMQAAKAKNAPWYALNFDLRHWFFQLPLPDTLKPLFTVRCNENMWYYPRSVPMGWSLAPRIAQAVTWSLLLARHAKHGKAPAVDPARYNGADAEMPAWLPLQKKGQVIGGIFVIMDNVFIVCTDADVTKLWLERLKNMGAAYDAQWKGEAPTEPEKFTPDNTRTTTFLGIDFGYDSWRTTHHDHDIQPAARMVRRELVSCLGEVLWDLRVRAEPYTAAFLHLYRVAYPDPDEGQDWDSTVDIGEPEYATLVAHVTTCRERRLRDALPAWRMDDAKNAQFWASDASQERIAAVPLGDMKGGMMDRPGAWHEESVAKYVHIAVAELAGIVLCVERGLEIDDSTRLFIVATDSTCAKGWVERGYSDRADAQELLDKLRGLLAGRRIMCPYVNTKKNIADVPTRLDEYGPVMHTDVDWSHTKDVQTRHDATVEVIRDAYDQAPLLGEMQGRVAIKFRRQRDEKDETTDAR